MNDFNKRLDEALQHNDMDQRGQPRPPETPADMSGVRIGIEFISGMLVGAGFGYGIDRYFNTLPLFLIIFLILGFAAGLMNILRVANGNGPGTNPLTGQAKPPTSTSTD